MNLEQGLAAASVVGFFIGCLSCKLWCIQGVANVAEIAKQCGVQRVVMVSSMLVTPKNW